MVAIAPELTIGFVRPSGLRSTASTELNASPVALTPIRSRIAAGPSRSQTRANTNGFETLMIVNSRSASPTAYALPSVLTTQMPNRSSGTRASAGYTFETAPSAFEPKRS